MTKELPLPAGWHRLKRRRNFVYRRFGRGHLIWSLVAGDFYLEVQRGIAGPGGDWWGPFKCNGNQVMAFDEAGRVEERFADTGWFRLVPNAGGSWPVGQMIAMLRNSGIEPESIPHYFRAPAAAAA